MIASPEDDTDASLLNHSKR